MHVIMGAMTARKALPGTAGNALLTVAMIATRLSVSQGHVRLMIRRGQLPAAHYEGIGIRITEAELAAHLAKVRQVRNRCSTRPAGDDPQAA